MRTVVITGANGFIGRNLICKLLQDNDTEIYALISGEAPPSWAQETRIHTIPCNLEQPIIVDSKQLPEGIDVLYHLAWHGVQPEMRNNLEEQLKNISIAMNVMSLAKEKRVRRLILPGSTNEYLYNDRPIDGNAIPTPANAYGSVKIALRYLCREYALENDIEFIYVIIAGIYAADRQDNNVIYYTIKNLLQEQKPILTKLEQKWDYVHIDDVVEALLAISCKGKNDTVYAIGHGDNWPLSEYIKVIHNLINPHLPLGIGEVPYKDNCMPSSCINLEQITRDTGFQPKIEFKKGITSVISKIKDEIQCH